MDKRGRLSKLLSLNGLMGQRVWLAGRDSQELTSEVLADMAETASLPHQLNRGREAVRGLSGNSPRVLGPKT